MKLRLITLSLLLGMTASASSFANQELATKKACLACHNIDNKVVGPAFKEVAKKYTGQKDAEAKLVQKVLKGGTGVWGTAVMPPNNVTEEEAKTLVKWVLSLK